MLYTKTSLAEICVAISGERANFWCFYCTICEMKPNIFEIFRTFSRYVEKNWEFPETYLGDFR